MEFLIVGLTVLWYCGFVLCVFGGVGGSVGVWACEFVGLCPFGCVWLCLFCMYVSVCRPYIFVGLCVSVRDSVIVCL